MQKTILAVLFGLVLGLLIRPTQPQLAPGNEQTIPSSVETQSNIVSGDLNQTVSKKLMLLQEELALSRFRIIQRKLLELSKKYPQTVAGKRAQKIIEQENLSVLANYGFGPENYFMEGIPACRYRFRTAISKSTP